MPELKIRKFPDSVLRAKTTRVGKVSRVEQEMLCEMAKTMYLTQGVGLAAAQVGIGKQLAVIDVGGGLIKMVNPVITKREGVESMEEGCLSCPGANVIIKRARKVTVSFLNEDGDLMELKAEGLLARAIQHELDHLSGKLIIDYLGPVKKLIAERKIRKSS